MPFLSACSTSTPQSLKFPNLSDIIPSLSMPEFYKTTVQQGSVLTHHTINQLKIGMSKQQVQELIGSPSVVDPFHNKQWDYINHSTLSSGEVVHYRLTLSFKKGKLNHINTDGISTLPKDVDKQKVLKK